MKDLSLMVKFQEKEFYITMKKIFVLNTKVNFSMKKDKVTGLSISEMAIGMKEILKMIHIMEKEFFIYQKEIDMKETLRIIGLMVWVHIITNPMVST